MVVDLGNSTALHFGSDDSRSEVKLERLISSLAHTVQLHRGSVLSFTGDGFIALFEEELWSHDAERCAREALDSAVEIASQVHVHAVNGSLEPAAGSDSAAGHDLTVRVALHYGRAWIPQSGPLREEIIGQDVVCASRLCAWLGSTIEPASPPQLCDATIGITGRFWSTLRHDGGAGATGTYSALCDAISGANLIGVTEMRLLANVEWPNWQHPEFKGLPPTMTDSELLENPINGARHSALPRPHSKGVSALALRREWLQLLSSRM